MFWIEESYSSLSESFEKETNNLRRRLLREKNIKLLHYNNLYDLSEKVVGRSSYWI